MVLIFAGTYFCGFCGKWPNPRKYGPAKCFENVFFLLFFADKDFMKSKFTKWFAQQLDTALDKGEELETINVDYRLSVMKLIHAKWMVDF